MIEEELGLQLALLQTYPFFALYNPVSLVPIANLLEKKTFKLGDTILEEEEYPTHMFFLQKGRVKLVKEDFVSRDLRIMKKLDNGTRKMHFKVFKKHGSLDSSLSSGKGEESGGIDQPDTVVHQFDLNDNNIQQQI